MRTRTQTRVAIALIPLGMLLFGCGKSETTYKTPQGDVTVNAKGNEVTVQATGKDGEKVTLAASETGVALPADFPKDVPILPGSKLRVALTQNKDRAVHLEAAGAMTDATKFYGSSLTDQGWKVENTMTTPEVSIVSARKGDRVCTVSAMKEGNGVLVQVVVTADGS